jgi:hypothetical protein
MTTLVYERELDPRGRNVVAQSTAIYTANVAHPWRTASPAELHRAGYVINGAADSTTYYAPSLEALLSPEFADDHCFRLVAGDDRRTLGVDFEPTRSRRGIADIRGSLWVDRTTSELRGGSPEWCSIRRHANLSPVLASRSMELTPPRPAMTTGDSRCLACCPATTR